jgi:hypothetical protein
LAVATSKIRLNQFDSSSQRILKKFPFGFQIPKARRDCRYQNPNDSAIGIVWVQSDREARNRPGTDPPLNLQSTTVVLLVLILQFEVFVFKEVSIVHD